MGDVWLAKHWLGEDVAVKILGAKHLQEPDAKINFHKEIQAHASLLHPNIVPLFDYGTLTDPPKSYAQNSTPLFVSMALAQFGDLTTLGQLHNWNQIWLLTKQLLDALAFAHARDVIHRDIKPKNILVFDGEDHPTFKLADFGIAHISATVQDAQTKMLSTSVGTPNYMAPEQIEGKWYQYGPWTDLYALGCTLYKMICGKPPFHGKTRYELYKQHLTVLRPPVDPLFEVPPTLERWLHKMMAIQPQDRFLCAAHAQQQLPPAFPDVPIWSTGLHTPIHTSEDKTLITYTTHETSNNTNDPIAFEAVDMTFEDLALFETAKHHQPSTEIPSWRQINDAPQMAPGMGLSLFNLREIPLCARTTEGDIIWSALSTVVRERKMQTIEINGTVGLGKSALAHGLARRAHELGLAHVLTASSQQGTQKHTIGVMLDQFFQSWKLNQATLYRHLKTRITPASRRDHPYLSDLQTLVRIMRPTEHMIDEQQTFITLERVVRRLTQQQPLILLLEHAATDEELARWLDHLRQTDQDIPILVLCMSEHANRGFTKIQIDRRLNLSPVSANDIHQMINAILPIDRSLSQHLHHHAEGNPLFAIQLLNHHIEQNELHLKDHARFILKSKHNAIPVDIQSIWLDRLTQLLKHFPQASHDDVSQAMELAAYFDEPFDMGTWQLCFQLAKLNPPAHLLDTLFEYGLLKSTDERWQLAHGLLTQSLQQMANMRQRQAKHHRVIAQALESQHPNPTWQTAQRIAQHWIAGQHPKLALPHLNFATTLLMDQHHIQHQGALTTLYRQTVQQCALEPTDTHVLASEIHYHCHIINESRFDEALHTLTVLYQQAMDQNQNKLAAYAALSIGDIHHRQGNIKSASTWDARAVTLCTQPETYYLAARGLRSAQYFTDSPDEAFHAIDRALQHLSGYNRLELLKTKINQLIDNQKLQQAQEVLDELLPEARKHNFLPLSLRAANSQGELARLQNQPSVAWKHYLEAQKLAMQTGHRHLIPLLDINLVLTAMMSKRWDISAQYLERAESSLIQMGTIGSRQWLIRVLYITQAAGTQKWDSVRSLLQPLLPKWPTEARLVIDHVHCLELTAQLTHPTHPQLAKDIWHITIDMWQRLKQPQQATRLQNHLATLTRFH